MRKATRKSTSGVEEIRSSGGNFSTRFSLPSFLKRVEKLTDEQRSAIKKIGFGNLLLLSNHMLNKNLLVELMERWSIDKRAFLLPPGKIEVTSMDVALILGLPVIGNPLTVLTLKEDEPFSDLEREFGAVKRKIAIASIECKLDSLGKDANDEFVRAFLLFTFGTLLFPNASGKVDSRYLFFLENLDDVCHFAWGGAVLEELVMWLNKRKEMSVQYMGGCLILLQIWAYEHIDIARPILLDTYLTFPRACRWENNMSHCRQRFTTKFDKLQHHQVIWKLQLTSVELELSMIKELLEAENEEKALPQNECSSIDVDAGAEIDSDKDIAVEVDDTLNVNLEQMRACILELPTKNIEPTLSSQDAGRDRTKSKEDDLRVGYEILKEQNLELKKENEKLKSENFLLRDQLSSRLPLEEQILKLKDEVEDLKRENQFLSSSTDNLVGRLESILLNDDVNAERA